jgi:glycosyltransferase involved in cell wall biosynthesis
MISVIIPTYNGEKTIGRAINSVLNQQGNFEIEIIVVDDCSTDRTVDIVQSFDGIRLFKTGKKNSGGPNKGRNIGMKKAKGDYICLLDQDDEWLPDKLIKQIDAINGNDVIYSGFIRIDENARN